ncbi:MAG: DUF1569 domain-containing protein, partial [Bacteroidota bacterium]
VDPATNETLIRRIDSLTHQSQRWWGTMTVAQVLKHLAVPSNDLISNKVRQPKMRLLGRLIFKPIMTGEKPYRKNSPTAKQFIITDEPEFVQGKKELKEKMLEIHGRGPDFFEGKEHFLLGRLKSHEWSNMLYKHLDHHLRQFGV